jgi:hypothetical protein
MPRTKFSYEQVVEAAKTHKTKRATALALGIDYETIQSYCRLWPSLERLFLTGREELVSAAESGLWKAVERGEAWAISFTLKTQGKHLGYTERQEIVTSGEPLEVVTEIVRVRRDG